MVYISPWLRAGAIGFPSHQSMHPILIRSAMVVKQAATVTKGDVLISATLHVAIPCTPYIMMHHIHILPSRSQPSLVYPIPVGCLRSHYPLHVTIDEALSLGIGCNH